jgi:hypothetical protein
VTNRAEFRSSDIDPATRDHGSLILPLYHTSGPEIRRRVNVDRRAVYVGDDPLDGMLMRVGASLVCLRVGETHAEFSEISLPQLLHEMSSYAHQVEVIRQRHRCAQHARDHGYDIPPDGYPLSWGELLGRPDPYYGG